MAKPSYGIVCELCRSGIPHRHDQHCDDYNNAGAYVARIERRNQRRFAYVVILGVVALILLCAVAFARDLDGRYAASPLKGWFDGLKSKKGLCCSFADGAVVEDADWKSQDGHYVVRLPDGNWYDVPDDAVINEPNRAGRTMVWPYTETGMTTEGGSSPSHAYTLTRIRCFIPGLMG